MTFHIEAAPNEVTAGIVITVRLHAQVFRCTIPVMPVRQECVWTAMPSPETVRCSFGYEAGFHAYRCGTDKIVVLSDGTVVEQG